MSAEQTVHQLMELRDALQRGELNIDDYYLSFEVLINGAPYEGRQLPPELSALINRMEFVRFTQRPEDQIKAATQVANDAIRLLAS
ncbi:hypothetical protein [Micromonospora mirobrigensis]|uniref:hypothetical protein n=1 Tax=Micromonospora mirobrigensis TaxID=262898 RepID=UPI00114CBD26|nr:hypothetical protein [Micromonospora mirobrigensis]